MREAREGRRQLAVEGVAPHAPEHAFGGVEHVLLLDERHLHVDLGELGLPVRAQVLVAQALGDLEVAVDAAAHEELLVELRRLREGEELSLVHAAGDEIVARALRGLPGEERRLDLDEALLGERGAHRVRDRVPEAQVALQLRAAEVEHAVSQAQLLRRRLLLRGLVDEDGERIRDGDPPQARHADLDLAGEHVGVRLGARGDDADGLHDILGVERSHEFERVRLRPLRAERELEEAGAVAEVYEEEAAEVAAAVYPPDDPDFAPGPRGLDLSAAGVAPSRRQGGRLTPLDRLR